MQVYEPELKNRVNFKKKRRAQLNNDIKKSARLRIIKRKSLTKRIKNLPKELQKKIFIFSMKSFYKRYLLEKPLFTFHNAYVRHINKMKKKVIIDNVHILHLDCNTLPENKKYIMGCQCDYCISCPRELKDEMYNYVGDSSPKFINSIGGLGNDFLGELEIFCNGVISPSEFFEYEYHTYSVGYDFKKDGFFSHLKEDPIESPIYFSSETEEMFKI